MNIYNNSAASEENLVEIKPETHIRYASEWDPRRPAHTKGGYLQGKIQLPKNMGDLKVVLSTVAAKPLVLDKDIIQKHPESQEVHPAIIYVVRMGKGKRIQEKEPVPNCHHWKQEFHIVNKCVRIKNKTSEADLSRYDKIFEITEMDDVCEVKDDMILTLGKRSTELNLVIILPTKTKEKEESGEEFSVKSVISDRISDPDVLKTVLQYYRKNKGVDSRIVKIKVEIFSLESNNLLLSHLSGLIFDTGSKHHQALQFCHVFPQRGCARGGRKVVMISENTLTSDIIPIFLLFDKDGKQIKEKDHFVIQPFPGNISILKEALILITPPQPHIEVIMNQGWSVKLVGVRKSDGCESQKFSFNFVPHDYYDPCIFCSLKPDGLDGKPMLPSPGGSNKNVGRKRKAEPNVKTKDNKNLQTRKQTDVLHLEDSNSDPDSPNVYEQISSLPAKDLENDIHSCKMEDIENHKFNLDSQYLDEQDNELTASELKIDIQNFKLENLDHDILNADIEKKQSAPSDQLQPISTLIPQIQPLYHESAISPLPTNNILNNLSILNHLGQLQPIPKSKPTDIENKIVVNRRLPVLVHLSQLQAIPNPTQNSRPNENDKSNYSDISPYSFIVKEECSNMLEPKDQYEINIEPEKMINNLVKIKQEVKSYPVILKPAGEKGIIPRIIRMIHPRQLSRQIPLKLVHDTSQLSSKIPLINCKIFQTKEYKEELDDLDNLDNLDVLSDNSMFFDKSHLH